ncbi:MAG: ATP-binding protein [Clostridiales bacterium]|nr:ATP-binding protein [Clostridiales bacterium]
MRIIPKDTKVKIEFFKGVELADVLVGTIGVAIDIALFTSNMPYKLVFLCAVTVLFGALILPFEDNGDKAYVFLFHMLTNVSRRKLYRQAGEPLATGALAGAGPDEYAALPGGGESGEFAQGSEPSAPDGGGEPGEYAAPRGDGESAEYAGDGAEPAESAGDGGDPAEPQGDGESGGLNGAGEPGESALRDADADGAGEAVADGTAPEAAPDGGGKAGKRAKKPRAAKAKPEKAAKAAKAGKASSAAKPGKAAKSGKAGAASKSGAAGKAGAAGKPGKSGKAGAAGGAKSAPAPEVADITPFTGISGEYIEYGGRYYGVVLEIPSIEFRFLTLSRQNGIIDRNLGAALRMVSEDGAAAIVKIDRPIIYDAFLAAEEDKLAEMGDALSNGLIAEDEHATRAAVIYARMEEIERTNTDSKIYRPFHYIVFFEPTKERAMERAQNALGLMGNADMDCRILSEGELAVFLKYNYTVDFDEREIARIPKEAYMDWILPKKIEFAGRTVKYDDLITHTLLLTDYPMEVPNAWGHLLFNTLSTRVVMKMKPVDRYKSVRRIDRAIDELRTRENATGKTSRRLELSSHIDTLSELLVLLQGDNEKLFDVNVFVTIYDYPQTRALRELAAGRKATLPGLQLKQNVRRQLAEQGFKTTDLFLRQFHAYASAHISAYDAFAGKSRSIHSGSIAAVFPFVYKALSDEGGIRVGSNGAVPVFINFFRRDRLRVNSNLVIIGKSGSGKSFATKTLLTNLAAEDSKVFILDPENEYGVLAENLRGKVIDVGNATQGRLNPFHIITTAEDDEDTPDGEISKGGNVSFTTHLQFLEEFFRQILPGIEPDAIEYLNNLLVRLYEDRNIDRDTDLSKLAPADYPTFDDLYDKILSEYQMVTGGYSKANLQVLLNFISKFSTGGRNSALWNGEATISTNENFIVFNFQSLLANKNNTVANAQMLLVLKWLDNEIIKNRDYNTAFGANRKIVIAIDEAHVFIDEKFPIALDFMFQLAKRIRKYNGMQIVITQNVKDFVGTEEIARKSTAIINACQYSFIFALAPNDMSDLVTLYEKAGAINPNEQEEIVNNGRGQAFVVTSPSDRTSIEVTATQQVQRLFERKGA